MPEAEGVLDPLMRTYEFLAYERRELCAGRPLPPARQLSDRLPLEVEADDGGALEHIPLVAGKGVEAGSEKRVHRGGHLVAVTAFNEHRQQLFDEQRIPRCHLADSSTRVALDVRVNEECCDQLF